MGVVLRVVCDFYLGFCIRSGFMEFGSYAHIVIAQALKEFDILYMILFES